MGGPLMETTMSESKEAKIFRMTMSSAIATERHADEAERAADEGRNDWAIDTHREAAREAARDAIEGAGLLAGTEFAGRAALYATSATQHAIAAYSVDREDRVGAAEWLAPRS